MQIFNELRIRFNKIDGFIKIYDGITFLVLFGCSWCDEICDRIKYLNKYKSHYYYNIFLEKGLYKDKSSTEYF